MQQNFVLLEQLFWFLLVVGLSDLPEVGVFDWQNFSTIRCVGSTGERPLFCHRHARVVHVDVY